MKLFLTILIGLFIYSTSISQVSDLLSVKKKSGAVIKTFIAGMPIVFITKNGMTVDGTIIAMRNDSVFVSIYDIGNIPTNMGVMVTDTIATYHVGVSYKEIKCVEVYTRRHFLRGNIGKILMLGGGGYFALNVINSAVLHEPVFEQSNVKNLGIALGVFAVGYVSNRLLRENPFSKKGDKIVYINMH